MGKFRTFYRQLFRQLVAAPMGSAGAAGSSLPIQSGPGDSPGAAGARTRGSLAYRTNREAIWKGKIPKKYLRLIEHVKGNRILELGSAEGVLALLLAQNKEKVIGLELSKERYEEALRLQAHWRNQGMNVDRCEFVQGNIVDRLDLLEQVDTFLGVRSIYYLRDDIQRVFEKIGQHARYVILCGNKNRAHRYFESGGNPDDKLGRFNFYASLEGMTSVLESVGYSIVTTVTEGDPIVVGTKELPPKAGRPS